MRTLNDDAGGSSPRAIDGALTHRLVHRAQHGDDDALNQLCSLYYAKVRCVVRRRLGRGLRRKTDSGEILQNTFRYAVAHFGSFEMRDRSSLMNWLCRIAENKIREAIDHYSAKKRRWIHPHVAEEHALRLASDQPAPLQCLVLEEETRQLRRCLACLPAHYRELIVLRDFANRPFDEIAASTGRPSPDAARMMHTAAVRALGRLLDRQRSA